MDAGKKIQRAVGRVILEKVCEHPNRVTPDVAAAAEEALFQLKAWEKAHNRDRWPEESESWMDFIRLLPVEKWPEICTDADNQCP